MKTINIKGITVILTLVLGVFFVNDVMGQIPRHTARGEQGCYSGYATSGKFACIKCYACRDYDKPEAPIVGYSCDPEQGQDKDCIQSCPECIGIFFRAKDVGDISKLIAIGRDIRNREVVIHIKATGEKFRAKNVRRTQGTVEGQDAIIYEYEYLGAIN